MSTRVMTFIRCIDVDFKFGLLDCACYTWVDYRGAEPYV